MLILRHGFDAMTVDKVAALAGVGKATVYRRWSRKEDLAVAAMDLLFADQMPPVDTGSLYGDLSASYAALLAFVGTDSGADYLRTALREALREPRIAAVYRNATHRATMRVREMFERARERGEVRPDADLTHAAQFVCGLITIRAVVGKPMPAESEVGDLVDVVLRGVASPDLPA